MYSILVAIIDSNYAEMFISDSKQLWNWYFNSWLKKIFSFWEQNQKIDIPRIHRIHFIPIGLSLIRLSRVSWSNPCELILTHGTSRDKKRHF